MSAVLKKFCSSLSLAAFAAGLLRVVPVAAQQASFAATDAHRAPEKTIVVGSTPPASARERVFHDTRDGVSFRVAPGWDLERKDGRVSTFREDARSIPPKTQLRAVAQIDFNPYPRSTFAGAYLYFSVQKKMTDLACERQATLQPAADRPDGESRKDVLTIGDLDFAHGHDEHGGICTEARDEVYAAYRRHVCYRFDLAINTFCAVSSGAQEITPEQLDAIRQRMLQMLSTVTFRWQTAAAETSAE